MEISPFSRGLAEGVINKGSEFAEAMGAVKGGEWSSAYLWDPAILQMRVHAGDLASYMKNLKRFDASLIDQLPAHLRDSWDATLANAQKVFNEVHTDQTGHYQQQLQSFSAYGSEVSTALKDLLAKADASSQAASDVIGGVTTNPGWEIVQDTPKATATVKAAEEGAAKVMTAGGQ